ncbi:MAG: endonuclease/exonuclease/phosphatase family protein [Sphaerochaetaceae bacterium]|nr:endonuclease/exonuclease/phosphatase family protein [Sphaerochaetaceae bacterium]
MKTVLRSLRWLLIGSGIAAAVLLLIAGGYVAYVVIQYDRIPDGIELAYENPRTGMLNLNDEYTIATYNIGFGAYGPAYSFFMDEGVMLDGTKVTGIHGKAESKESVQHDTNGAIDILQELDSDFVMLQEVDIDSTRSYHINQVGEITKAMPEYGYTVAVNFHSAWLHYPLNDPHGKTNSSLLTLSKYSLEDNIRRSYPVDEGFPTRFFDLDRCFAVHRVPVENGKELVLVNSHMSAYDKGGLIRTQQLAMLNQIASEEYEKGNYVIIGGDFNHALGEVAAQAFPSQQEFPGWVFILTDEDLAPGLRIVKAENETTVPTCRAAELPYEKGVNFTTVVDGFIVSDNVKAKARNIDTDFAYSDHQPVLLWFELE